MVIKAVTGHSWEYEVRARILRPLRLTRTLTPGNWPFLPSPHARYYQQFEAGGAMTDTTVAYLPFDADADGSMISAVADTNRFFTALVQGRLLAPAQLAEMQRTVEVPADHGFPPVLDTTVLRRRVLGAQRRRIRIPGVACHDSGRPDHRHGLLAQPTGRSKHRHSADPRRYGSRRPRTVLRSSTADVCMNSTRQQR
ncbi:beta-lactamase family protein [Streptomyces sp. Root369]|uniref:beta-lactamase family protein n=1 Tax=Streptomyces sp. Root369 TaxID=1736523 RepID=UPI000A6536C0|nr:beta-lactamase family protein [Streptomyces sp. Root369]